jgi:hypothetical protein
MVATTLAACAQTPPPRRSVQSFDPTLVREQQRRIAAFDSVVRTVKTDSLYRLWQASGKLPVPVLAIGGAQSYGPTSPSP